MEPDCSLPHSKHPATRSYPEPDQSSPCSPPLPPKFWRSILLLMFGVRNLVPFLHCLGCTTGPVEDRCLVKCCITWLFFNPPRLEDHPFLGVRDCLFNIFAAILHIWRPFFHPQPLRTRHDVVTRTHLPRASTWTLLGIGPPCTVPLLVDGYSVMYFWWLSWQVVGNPNRLGVRTSLGQLWLTIFNWNE
jgi:hypothetical protein